MLLLLIPNLPHVAFAVPGALVADLGWLITTRAGWQRLGLGWALEVLLAPNRTCQDSLIRLRPGAGALVAGLWCRGVAPRAGLAVV